MTDRVFIAGPAAWNHLVELDRLPDPVPHMQFALGDWETMGGTSAGKALGLAGLGRPVTLHTLLGDDAEGRRVRGALTGAGVDLIAGDGVTTERHLNLMTRAGGRVSLYLATPQPVDDAPSPDAMAAMSDAAALVLDLAPLSVGLLPAARATGLPIWTDIHDYDGETEFHRPFIEAADVIFMNADRIGDDPFPFMEPCIERGASLVVCTLGAEGAVAVDERMRRHHVAAEPVEVLDTNGAGDAFMAGVLDATLAGSPLPDALRAGARHAASVLMTRHLHPSLDALLP
ncbi:carbohydrate kinase family protein [Agromyces sp. Marseille-P2726]|uniref:carbohydrate kinase family protein n=1 Tax=Agromyces sp. Marseille-P2726 TaxID=2709132 RepID=UPI00156FBCE6|nr:carbohydrate kinase family protein [Agromyces sp. Marseille-P2726]